MTEALLGVQGVHKSFDANRVLSGIDLSIARHEVVAMIGPSGSGKSTLLKCINLIEPIDAGAVFLDGAEISAPGVDQDRIRTHIGLVFQSFNLFPHMTVLENVVLAPVRAHSTPRQEARDRARALLARFGLAGREDDYPDRLSGGQQQRVAIVRALATRPRALLLDEVTSALDPELVGEVLRAVRDLKAEGVTMLLATHEMSFAREVADTVCFLHEGRLLEVGRPEQVLESPSQPETKRFLRRLLEAGRA